MMFAQDVIIRPVLTEKSYADIANKKYTFEVAKDANKTQIKQAVETLFKVKVKSVNTANVFGKIKRQGRFEGLTGNYKKAIVQLTSDSKSIEFFDSLS
ncbi:MAG: 50S ribosomal protein L23 [Clostridia bacterium]|nr:50S ribosomal protein L23 [Clostridia bacterium]